MEHEDKSRQRFTRKLDALRKKNAFPESLLDLLEQVVARQFQAVEGFDFSQVSVPQPPSERRRVQGASLLPRSSFPLFLEQAGPLFLDIIKDVVKIGGELGVGADRVKEALETEELTLEKVFRAFLDEDKALFDAWSEKTPGAPRTLHFLAQSSLSPFVEGLGRHIEQGCPSPQLWEHGHCPTCGSLPFISSLQTKEGMRMMHCSFCRGEYRVPRLGCVYCGEKDAQRLRYFQVDEVPGFRVDLCDHCKMCIKTVDFRTMDRVSVPSLDDLESLPLDVLANSRGYVRPTLSAWGF